MTERTRNEVYTYSHVSVSVSLIKDFGLKYWRRQHLQLIRSYEATKTF